MTLQNRPFEGRTEGREGGEDMSPELLAQAVQEDELRDELVDRLSPEEVAAFDDYVSGYHAREYVIDKKDS